MAAELATYYHTSDRVRRLTGIQRSPIVRTRGGIDYQVHKVTRRNRDELRERVLPFEKDFGYLSSFRTHEKVIHYVREGAEVVFAVLPGSPSRDIGVVTQELKRVSVGGREMNVQSVGIRVVLEGHQQRGIGRNLLSEGITRLHPDAVTGLSRTWRIFRMLEDSQLLFPTIEPIDQPFSVDTQEQLRQALDKSIFTQIDLRTGLCRGVLPPADAARLIPSPDNLKGIEIYKRMWSGPRGDAHPEFGDAIRYFVKVDANAVDVLIREGWGDTREIPAMLQPQSLLSRIRDYLQLRR